MLERKTRPRADLDFVHRRNDGDKDGNLLRTRYLDYNTKDSIAVFNGGASMKDSKGQLIESMKGTYESQDKLFTFEQQVNMFSDSIFVKTDRLLYHSETNKADFEAPLDAWKEDNMLSADRGEYDREVETFRFYENVHLQSPDKEAWADTLYFERETNNIEMLGSVQITDEGRRVTGLGNYLYYEDTLSRVTLSREAAVVIELEQSSEEQEGDKKDTLYLGADRMIYQALRKCDVDPDELGEAERRRSEMLVDPVSQYREKAAADAAAKAEEARKAADERSGKADADRRAGKIGPGNQGPDEPRSPLEAPGIDEPSGSPEPSAPEDPDDGEEDDTPPEESDTPMERNITPPEENDTPTEGNITPPEESDTPLEENTTPPEDVVAPREIGTQGEDVAPGEAVSPDGGIPPEGDTDVQTPQDTTKVGFVWAVGDVRVYKSDMQARCDSLVFADLDSLVRMYVDPVIWNEGSRQYVADSLSALVADGRMQKANLMSSAFIVIQEDSTYFDQISSTEMTAYFDTTSALQRFDALGGVQAVFYIEENDALATVNKVNSKMLSAYFAEGQIDKIYYFESPKSDAYPTVQLPQEDRRMKGFKWDPERRPAGRADITLLEPRSSERAEYDARPRAAFRQTDIYFPGYIPGIYKEIAVRDSLAKVAPPQIEEAPDGGTGAAGSEISEGMEEPGDSTAIALADTSAVAPADSTAIVPGEDKKAAEDSAWVDLDTALEQLAAATPEPSKGELRRQAREEKWAMKDARDAAKAEAKAAKALEKERARKRKLVAAMEKQAAKDAKALERYKARYEKRQARLAAKAAAKAAKKGPETETEATREEQPQLFEPIRENKQLLPAEHPKNLEVSGDPAESTPKT